MSGYTNGMDYRLDDIDRRIIYELMCDARNTSAPTIAEAMSVSPGTIRNRIDQLEDHGIITNYAASIDFERADGRLTNLYLCNVPVPERDALAQEARAIPGVVNVRELMTGRRNLHVLAVGDGTEDLRRISRALSTIGVEIEDEDLVEAEYDSPYAAFGPEEARTRPHGATDFIDLSGDAHIVETTVEADAPVVDGTIEEAVESGILDDETLVIAIERDERVLTPHGDTELAPDDVVTVLSRGGDGDRVMSAFGEEHRSIEE